MVTLFSRVEAGTTSSFIFVCVYVNVLMEYVILGAGLFLLSRVTKVLGGTYRTPLEAKQNKEQTMSCTSCPPRSTYEEA